MSEVNSPYNYLQAWADFNEECQLAFNDMPNSPAKARAIKLLNLSNQLFAYSVGNVESLEQGPGIWSEHESAIMHHADEMTALIAVNALLLHPDDEMLELALAAREEMSKPPAQIQVGLRLGE